MDKRGKIILRDNLGGGSKVTGHNSAPTREVRRHAPRKCLISRPSEIASGTFSGHLWFSNDMMR